MARRSRRTVRDDSKYLPEDADDEVEEEEEERPRRRRSSRDEDDEPRSSRRRRSSRDEDDDEDDDDEDEPPRRSRGKSSSKGKSSRSRRSRDDDDDDEPTPRRKVTGAGGWNRSKKVKEKTSSFARAWKVEPGDDEVLIKFLEDEPFAVFGQHWFEEIKGKKGWICMETLPDPEECPACEAGDSNIRYQALFSILVFDDDGEPTNEILSAGKWLSDQLENLHESRNGPLTKHYWAISATGGGKQGPVKYDLQVVKERDLEDDWEIEPLEDDELAAFADEERTLDEVEQIPSRSDYKAMVRSLD